MNWVLLSYKCRESSMLSPLLRFLGSWAEGLGVTSCDFSGQMPPPGHLSFCGYCPLLSTLLPELGPLLLHSPKHLLKVTDFYWKAEGTECNQRAAGKNSKSSTGHDFCSRFFSLWKDLPLQPWGLLSHGNLSLLTFSTSLRDHTIPPSKESFQKTLLLYYRDQFLSLHFNHLLSVQVQKEPVTNEPHRDPLTRKEYWSFPSPQFKYKNFLFVLFEVELLIGIQYLRLYSIGDAFLGLCL